MSDPSLGNVPFSRWLSVPEGPPQEVWESALENALETAAAEPAAEGTGDDAHSRAEEPAAHDVVVAWGEDPGGDPAREAGSDRADPTDDVDVAIPMWEVPDGDDGS